MVQVREMERSTVAGLRLTSAFPSAALLGTSLGTSRKIPDPDHNTTHTGHLSAQELVEHLDLSKPAEARLAKALVTVDREDRFPVKLTLEELTVIKAWMANPPPGFQLALMRADKTTEQSTNDGKSDEEIEEENTEKFVRHYVRLQQAQRNEILNIPNLGNRIDQITEEEITDVREFIAQLEQDRKIAEIERAKTQQEKAQLQERITANEGRLARLDKSIKALEGDLDVNVQAQARIMTDRTQYFPGIKDKVKAYNDSLMELGSVSERLFGTKYPSISRDASGNFTYQGQPLDPVKYKDFIDARRKTDAAFDEWRKATDEHDIDEQALKDLRTQNEEMQRKLDRLREDRNLVEQEMQRDKSAMAALEKKLIDLDTRIAQIDTKLTEAKTQLEDLEKFAKIQDKVGDRTEKLQAGEINAYEFLHGTKDGSIPPLPEKVRKTLIAEYPEAFADLDPSGIKKGSIHPERDVEAATGLSNQGVVAEIKKTATEAFAATAGIEVPAPKSEIAPTAEPNLDAAAAAARLAEQARLQVKAANTL